MTSNSPKPNPPAVDDEVWVGYYVVCLVDLLGQKAGLDKWAQLPPDLQPTPALINALKETAGSVQAFRQMFESYFQEWEQPHFSQAWIDSLPQDKKDLYWRSKDCRLSTQQFGDTFVFFSPTSNSSGDVSMDGMLRILVACCWAMTFSLAGRVPLRGAICVGTGMELDEHNFYGPALAKAHFLESKVAGHPRVVLSREAVRFVQGNAGFSEAPTIEALMKQVAATCRTLLCEDEDGQVIVDFLGKGCLGVQGEVDSEMVSAVEKAYRFVCSEALRFGQEGDTKHAERYTLLRRYVKARLPLWGLAHLLETDSA
ncbi:MAG: hypothetical protein R6X20_07320 [Phycisphaerae bacterium]